jgi:DNA mismatch repair protein MutS
MPDNSAAATEPALTVREPTSPVIQQYLDIKRDHPDCLIFLRIGEFYEVLFDDAVAASTALNIALTTRSGTQIPMCGVPAQSFPSHLARLVREGHRVAQCEQVNEDRTSPRKGEVTRRKVTRIYTPGTITEEDLLDPRSSNHLAAITEIGGRTPVIALAWADISNGPLQCQTVTPQSLSDTVARIDPSEIIVADRLRANRTVERFMTEWKSRINFLPDSRFSPESAHNRLIKQYRVQNLDGFGEFSTAEVSALGSLVDYACLTQGSTSLRLLPPKRFPIDSTLQIDASTRRSLELTRTVSGNRAGSLLDTLDRTVTAAGSRLLTANLSAPLTNPRAINSRLDMVEFLFERMELCECLRGLMQACSDIERILSRLSMDRGGPRDLLALKASLDSIALIRKTLDDPSLEPLPAPLKATARAISPLPELAHHIELAINPESPSKARDGNIINAGYSTELDDLIQLRDNSRKLIIQLQAEYVETTGASGLKIKHNTLHGYFVEVPLNQAERLGSFKHPSSGENLFIQRQGLTNASRFTTEELRSLEGKIADAADRSLSLEQDLYHDLVENALLDAELLTATAKALAALDMTAGLAKLAHNRRYCRPVMDTGTELVIRKGRHPVVETIMDEGGGSAPGGSHFIPNDCILDSGNSLWLLTGPNMGGKSTFLKQNALIAIMAQIGSFVPAESCRMGIADRIFSRVGAADDLARGHSTFMVEMTETASIMNLATERSIVILDEIGRGTSTLDGLAIAQACIEYLHDRIDCRALFATHYHELTELADRLRGLSCHTVKVREWEGFIIFLHEVVPGVADRSYGIHVAKLAGLPHPLTARAEEILKELERNRTVRSPER